MPKSLGSWRGGLCTGQGCWRRGGHEVCVQSAGTVKPPLLRPNVTFRDSWGLVMTG